MKKTEAEEIVPGIVIDEVNEKLIDEEGWFKLGRLETGEESLARVKEVVKTLKEKYEEFKGQTVLVVTHGAFLNDLICTYTNNVSNSKRDYYIVENNSITIMDFEHKKDGAREFVDA